MHPYTIKAASLPRLFTRTAKVYLLLTSHTSPWLNSHTCILQAFWGTKNCTCAHLGISNTYTYTNFMMNLDYLHNKVLHFLRLENIDNKLPPQQVKLQNPANHPTLNKDKRHGWGPLLKRNSKVLLPPPQPRPGEKDCIIHQLRDNKRLIFKDHIISRVPDRYCCCYPPNLPLSIRSPRSSQGEVLSEVVPRPTMQDSVFLDPRVELPPQWHNFFACEKKVRGRFNLTLAEGAEKSNYVSCLS